MTDTIEMDARELAGLVALTRCAACEACMGAPRDGRELCADCRAALARSARSEGELRAMQEER